jgi:4-hydroxy-4-methyl-2-oxoglutarate aldolase
MNIRMLLTLGLAVAQIWALQGLTPTRDELIALTVSWTGERYPDGRPKVPEEILERMKKVSLEEAWGTLQSAGYRTQFEGNWHIIHPDQPLVGRALTAVYLPNRPDLDARIRALGKEQKRIGPSNSWPIDMLEKGDLYVADGFGKIIDGTLIGDNLGNAIFSRSGTGVVFDGSARDLEGLSRIEGFNAFVRGWDPSAIKDMTLGAINVPTRIGRVTVLPGDVVLAKRGGVIFIPPHLAERVVVEAEIVAVKDEFGHQRLREGIYTPGQVDRRWTPDIIEDFLRWLEQNPGKLDLPTEEIRKQL